jgi:hypothetical protein
MEEDNVDNAKDVLLDVHKDVGTCVKPILISCQESSLIDLIQTEGSSSEHDSDDMYLSEAIRLSSESDAGSDEVPSSSETEPKRASRSNARVVLTDSDSGREGPVLRSSRRNDGQGPSSRKRRRNYVEAPSPPERDSDS